MPVQADALGDDNYVYEQPVPVQADAAYALFRDPGDVPHRTVAAVQGSSRVE